MNTPITELKGLVICGGSSKRMGKEKYALRYHGKPQYQYIASLMQGLTDAVFVSINTGQNEDDFTGAKCIPDAEKFMGNGPLTALLSAFEKYPGAAFLVAGCDYPFLKRSDLEKLCEARIPAYDAICYTLNGIDEPLITIYESHCAGHLLKYFNAGNFSLRHFLNTVNTKRIQPDAPDHLKSVDTPEEYENALIRLQNKK